MATRVKFDEKLNELQRMVVEMGVKTYKTIEDALLAFVDLDVNVCQRIVDEDSVINQMEFEIYSSSTLLIAEEQPVARDLRIILNAIRTGHVLERVADSAAHIANSTIILKKRKLRATPC